MRNTLGSCGGCNIVTIAIGLVRWEGLSVNDAESRVKHDYCPPGENPDISVTTNRDASYAMGQRREENLEGLMSIPRQGWLVKRG